MTSHLDLQLETGELSKKDYLSLLNKIKKLKFKIELFQGYNRGKLVEEAVYDLEEKDFIDLLARLDRFVFMVTLSEDHPKFREANLEIELTITKKAVHLSFEDYIIRDYLSNSIISLLKELIASLKGNVKNATILFNDEEIFSGAFNSSFLDKFVKNVEELREGGSL